MPTKILWRQEDREDAPMQARRLLINAEAALTAMADIYDARLDHLRAQGPALLQRVLAPLRDEINRARTLVEAYDYFVTRCLEAGLAPDQAYTAWEEGSAEVEGSAEDFEAELVTAESYGPNAIPMIDTTLLPRLGIAPLPADGDETDDVS